MKKIKLLLFLLVGFAHGAVAQSDEAYRQTISKRVDKILIAVSITDSLKYKTVKETIAGQYISLNDFYEQKRAEGNSKTPLTSGDSAKLNAMHRQFLAALSVQLAQTEVEKIKDGMTYGVLPVTYLAYQDMIPSLKEVEKSKILSWLTEAREFAMDAGTSDGKHAVFGKYKGRINNYLSAQGYDLQQERKAWEERIKKSTQK